MVVPLVNTTVTVTYSNKIELWIC